ATVRSSGIPRANWRRGGRKNRNRADTSHWTIQNCSAFSKLGFCRTKLRKWPVGTVNYHIEKSSTFGDARAVGQLGKAGFAPALLVLSHLASNWAISVENKAPRQSAGKM